MWGFVKNALAVGTQLVDLILPPRARTLRMRAHALDDLHLTPTVHTLCGVSITTLFDYRLGAAQDAIRALKYDGSSRAASLLGAALADHLREEISSMQTLSPRRVILVPTPLHPLRLRERGFNQIERVLHALPPEFHNGTLSIVAPHTLTRTRATPPQTKLSRRERLANVRGAFAIGTTPELHTAHLIIIDDVVTTGATLAACSRRAQKTGARVTAMALARA